MIDLSDANVVIIVFMVVALTVGTVIHFNLERTWARLNGKAIQAQSTTRTAPPHRARSTVFEFHMAVGGFAIRFNIERIRPRRVNPDTSL